MYSILASIVEISRDGQTLRVNRGDLIPIVFFVFILLAMGLGVFPLLYKKRLEHKQIMAAIEKGTPLSDLRPVKYKGPAWIRNLTAGVALLITSLGFAYMAWQKPFNTGAVIAGFVFCGLGVCFLIRGLLLRKVNGQEKI